MSLTRRVAGLPTDAFAARIGGARGMSHSACVGTCRASSSVAPLTGYGPSGHVREGGRLQFYRDQGRVAKGIARSHPGPFVMR